jgi:small nuclear ribonucleoprotein (snRNP)-like protein
VSVCVSVCVCACLSVVSARVCACVGSLCARVGSLCACLCVCRLSLCACRLSLCVSVRVCACLRVSAGSLSVFVYHLHACVSLCACLSSVSLSFVLCHTCISPALTYILSICPCSYLTEIVSVITNDGRHIVGILKGFDQAVNVILEQCHERRYTEEKGVEQIELGIYVLRGDNVYVLSLSVAACLCLCLFSRPLHSPHALAHPRCLSPTSHCCCLFHPRIVLLWVV